MAGKRAADDVSIEDLIKGLDEQVSRRLLANAAQSHEDVLRAVRLAAADGPDRLAVLKAAVDDGLRTRRHLDYLGSSPWAGDAAPVLDALADEVAAEPSAELVELLQRAEGHLVKVIMRADDSNGMIGDLARRALDLHREACAAGVADPQRLAKWMVRFSFEDQDFFEIDPVAYVDPLGEKGLAVYRREVAKWSDPADVPADRSPTMREVYGGFPSFAAKYAAERLAIIDRDVDRLVALLGRDLSSPYQFARVAEAMVELGLTGDALAWARRGIAETTGWQVAKLYDLVAGLLGDEHDLDGVVDLADDATDEAWAAATTGGGELSSAQWLRLAEAREPTEPTDAMAVYLRLADDVLGRADKRAYRDAIRLLKAARRAGTAADRTARFDDHLTGLRERNRRRPSFMTMLDKAGLR